MEYYSATEKEHNIDTFDDLDRSLKHYVDANNSCMTAACFLPQKVQKRGKSNVEQ